MKRLFSFSTTSTVTFVLSILAILAIAVSAPGVVQAFGSLSENGTAAYMGIGISTPVSPLHIYSTTATQPETFDLSTKQPLSAMWNDYCNTGGAFSGAGFLARYARGTMASPANVHSGDRLGYNVFGGWVGNWFHTAAIEAVVDTGTVSGSSLPTYMRFLTTPDGSTARAERMRITAAGNVGINTASPDSNSQLAVSRSGGTSILGTNTDGNGVAGYSSSGCGVRGDANTGTGVYGNASGVASGVSGQSADGYGVQGTSTTGSSVYGKNTTSNNYGYLGGASYGVYGRYGTTGPWGALGDDEFGVVGGYDGYNYGRLGSETEGVYGYSDVAGVIGAHHGTNNNGKLGTDTAGVSGGSSNGYAIFGQSANNFAGYFIGSVRVTDNLTVSDNVTVGGIASIGTLSRPNSTLQVKGSLATAFAAKDADYTATDIDSVIAVDTTGDEVTITLPTAVGCAGRTYTIKKIVSINEVIVDGAGGTETIDGAVSYSMNAQWEFVTVVSDGANWLIIGANKAAPLT